MDDKVMQLAVNVERLMEVQKQKERLLMKVMGMCLTQLKKPDSKKQEVIDALEKLLITMGENDVAVRNGERTH